VPDGSTNARVDEPALRGAKTVPLTDLPVVDIGPLFGKDRKAKEAVALEIDKACREVGFLYLRNHGIPDEMTQAAFDEARRFFALTVEEKMKIHVKKVRTLTRGYVPMYEVHADKDAKPDFHEAFESALEVAPDDPDHLAGNLLYGPNQWPSNLPGFRETVYGYYEALNRLGRTLFTGFAIALNLPEDYFEDVITKPTAGFRLMHYPLQENLNDTGAWGIGAHTDQECFTLLVQDSFSALQLKNAQDQWVEARPVADTIIVNIGDLMPRWTNDRYRSTAHRVLNPIAHARYSMGYFFGPDYDTPIACLPSCQDADHPAKYEPITAGEFCEARVLSYHYET
jgi:isopenicillin N synthase-like dioxygenase